MLNNQNFKIKSVTQNKIFIFKSIFSMWLYNIHSRSCGVTLKTNTATNYFHTSAIINSNNEGKNINNESNHDKLPKEINPDSVYNPNEITTDNVSNPNEITQDSVSKA